MKAFNYEDLTECALVYLQHQGYCAILRKPPRWGGLTLFSRDEIMSGDVGGMIDTRSYMFRNNGTHGDDGGGYYKILAYKIMDCVPYVLRCVMMQEEPTSRYIDDNDARWDWSCDPQRFPVKSYQPGDPIPDTDPDKEEYLTLESVLRSPTR